MSSYASITSDKLSRLIGTPHTPVVIDVRLDEDFDAWVNDLTVPRLMPKMYSGAIAAIVARLIS
jgi:hypothetical protein